MCKRLGLDRKGQAKHDTQVNNLERRFFITDLVNELGSLTSEDMKQSFNFGCSIEDILRGSKGILVEVSVFGGI